MYDILIAGGGYAGLWAALGAMRQLDQVGASRTVGLISRTPFLTARPRLYERGLSESDAQIPLAPVLEAVGADLIEADIARIDDGAHRLVLADGRAIEFGTLVLATGSIARPPQIDGWEQHGHGIDTWPQARHLWRRLGELAGSAPVVAVLGAGFTGLELVTELAGWRDAEAPHARILLLERGPVVAAGYGSEARQFILDVLARLQIEVHCDATAVVRSADALLLAEGRRVACDVAVWAGGLQPASLLPGVQGSRLADNRLSVDRRLRVAPGIFAAGDIAGVPLPEGQTTVLSCQHALSTGSFAGHNAARERLGLDLIDYAPLPYVTCLDLGPGGALLTKGFDRSLTLAGEAAKPIKQNINRRIIVPPLEGGRDALLASATLERKRSLPS